MDNKLFSYILIGLLGLSALLCVLFFAGVISEGLIITWCYILLVTAVLLAIIFWIVGMIQNPQKAKMALIGLVGLVVICGVGYGLAGGEEFIDYEGKLLASAGESKMSEAGLIAFYLLGAGAIGSIVYAEVSKMLK